MLTARSKLTATAAASDGCIAFVSGKKTADVSRIKQANPEISKINS